jgi:hypothetical protein
MWVIGGDARQNRSRVSYFAIECLGCSLPAAGSSGRSTRGEEWPSGRTHTNPGADTVIDIEIQQK